MMNLGTIERLATGTEHRDRLIRGVKDYQRLLKESDVCSSLILFL